MYECTAAVKSTVIGSEDDEEAVAVNKGDRKVEASVGN